MTPKSGFVDTLLNVRLRRFNETIYETILQITLQAQALYLNQVLH